MNIRSVLLRLALGERAFNYMMRSIRASKAGPAAHFVNVKTRKDGQWFEAEADWIKKIAQITATRNKQETP